MYVFLNGLTSVHVKSQVPRYTAFFFKVLFKGKDPGLKS